MDLLLFPLNVTKIFPIFYKIFDLGFLWWVFTLPTIPPHVILNFGDKWFFTVILSLFYLVSHLLQMLCKVFFLIRFCGMLMVLFQFTLFMNLSVWNGLSGQYISHLYTFLQVIVISSLFTFNFVLLHDEYVWFTDYNSSKFIIIPILR